MFFGGDRIDAVREMILADDEAGRRKALAKLLPMQRKDFLGIFRVMGPRPVTIRTLDPPLHEFLPHDEAGSRRWRRSSACRRRRWRRGSSTCTSSTRCSGTAGAASASFFPEITEMQSRAIFEAACAAKKEGIDVKPEVMIPLVGFVNELKKQEEIVRSVAAEVFREKGVKVK